MALRLRPGEWLLAGYASIVIVVAALRMASYPATIWVIVAHALLLLLVGLLARLGSRPGLPALLRAGAPMVVLLALYGALDILSGFGARTTYDPVVRGWEVAIFGGEPSREWWRRFPSELWSSVLHGVYFSYYFVVPAPVIVYLRQRRPREVSRTLFALLATFVACYLIFIFLPVAGPYYEYARPDSWFVANAPAQAVYGVLARGSAYGAAFPSSHVAATWVAAAMAWRANRFLSMALGGLALLLTVGVVYCQMHYAVDAGSGVIVAALVVLLTAIVFPPDPDSAGAETTAGSRSEDRDPAHSLTRPTTAGR